LALASALPLLPFYFKHFLLASSFFKGEKKKKKEGKKKTIEKEKNAEKGRSFSPVLPSHFWLPLLPSRFCPSISNTFS
jgi:hypothetical protein